MSEIEQVQAEINVQEYKYIQALEDHESYSILKGIREKIKELKEALQIMRLHADN